MREGWRSRAVFKLEQLQAKERIAADRMHVRNRGFVTSSKKGYAIRWDTLASEWDENLVNFDVIADGFRPVRG